MQKCNKKIYEAIKRLFDVIIAAVSFILFLPVMLIAVVAICLESKGCPFFTHTRVGKGGKKFKMFKLRSMRINETPIEQLLTAEQLNELRTEYKLQDDPRVTRVGKFIRRCSVDELPQLINILTGDMSIVGPRPLVEKELEYYGSDVNKLLSVRPGLTGYWQAYARNDATYQSGLRQSMELYYVDNRSLLFDFRIIIKTIGAVLNKSGV